jgi:hypothetical protein
MWVAIGQFLWTKHLERFAMEKLCTLCSIMVAWPSPVWPPGPHGPLSNAGLRSDGSQRPGLPAPALLAVITSTLNTDLYNQSGHPQWVDFQFPFSHSYVYFKKINNFKQHIFIGHLYYSGGRVLPAVVLPISWPWHGTMYGAAWPSQCQPIPCACAVTSVNW